MSAPRGRRHVYFMDGDRKVAHPIHAHWYTHSGVQELNEKLRSPPVALRLLAVGKEIPPASRMRLGLEAVRLTRQVTAALFQKLKPLALKHVLNYPLPEIDPDRFASPVGRAASERYLRTLRLHDPSFSPRTFPRVDFVPPIVILGTSRTAESLRMHALFGPAIAWRHLENQRSNAHADYCLDVAAIGSDTTLALLDHWWEGKEASAEHGVLEAYDTLFHESLHRLCDLTNPFGPQYGPKGSAKEHYWMQEYEPFATQVERVIVSHLSAGGERGLLRRRVMGKS